MVTEKNAAIVIGYRFGLGPKYGYLGNYTRTWPDHCGALFPSSCDPSNGLRFSVVFDNVPEGETVVASAAKGIEAPAYMLGWAHGKYTYERIGTTEMGTEVGVYYLPGSRELALRGTRFLPSSFAWFEKTLGRYRYGRRVASVETNGGGSMELHPFWHVSSTRFGNPIEHIHEAAHGWFGNAVRIACWEDLLLSEGTASYLTARAVEVAAGPEAAKILWRSYEHDVKDQMAKRDHPPWPEGCGAISVESPEEGIWTAITYKKTALFFRALESELEEQFGDEGSGRSFLDRVLREFYERNVGKSARMDQLLEMIQAITGYDYRRLSDEWLRSRGLPSKNS